MKMGKWDGKLRLFSASTGLLPFGLKKDLIAFLEEHDYEAFDETVKLEIDFTKENVVEFLQSMNISNGKGEIIKANLHQIEALEHCASSGRAVVLSPTSSGKSLIIYLLVRLMDTKTCIIVPSTSLVHQLYTNFEEYSEFDESFVVEELCNKVYSGMPKNTGHKITITTWQSLNDFKDIEFYKSFEMVIVDEVHTAKAKVLGDVLERFTEANFRYGFTGTLDDSELGDYKIRGIFGDIVQFVTTKELMDSGIVANVEIKMLFLQYPRELSEIICSKAITYQNEIEFITKLPKRNGFISAIAKGSTGNTLILFNNISHGDELKLKLEKILGPEREIFVIVGGVDSKERERLRKLTEKKDGVIILATYGVFSTGVSINKLHNIIFAHPTKSKIRVIQSIGRLLRLHETKDTATVYDIVDDFSFKTSKGTLKKNFLLEHGLHRSKFYMKEQYPFVVKKLDFEA
jgi:superfamily II DNA or RNA helicase